MKKVISIITTLLFASPIFSQTIGVTDMFYSIKPLYFVIGFFIISFLLILIFFWNRTLKLRVTKKTDELTSSEEFIKTIMNNLHIGIAVNTIEPTVNFIYMNDKFHEIYRTSKEALANPDSFWEAVYEDPDFREKMKKRVLDDCASLDPERMIWENIPIKRIGKEVFYISARNILLPGKNLMISTVWDVTERKQAENALILSKSRYQSLFNNSPAPLWVEDLNELLSFLNELKEEGVNDFDNYFDQNPQQLVVCAQKVKVIDVNEATVKLHNARYKEELLGNLDRVFTQNSFEVFKQEVIALANGQREFQSETEAKTLTGETKFVLLKLVIEEELDGTNRALLFTMDTTERRNAEDALKNREQILKLFLEYTPASIAMFDTGMRYVAVSQRFLSNYKPADPDLIGKCHYDVFPETPERWRKVHQRCLAGAVETSDEDLFRRSDGQIDWVKWEIRPWYEHDGKIGGITLFIEVITEQKRTEKALRHSEEIFNSFMEHSPIYVFFKDKHMKSLRLSKNYEEMLGRPLEELLGKSMDELFPSDLAKQMVADDIKIMEDGKIFKVEEVFNGLIYHTIKFPIIIDEEPQYLAGYTIDITERKLAEKELQRQINHTQLLLQTTLDGYMLSDTSGQIIEVNPAYCRLIGYSNEELLKMNSLELEVGSGNKEYKARLERLIRQGSARFETLHERKNGVLLNVDLSITLINQERPLLVTFVRDITERIRAEMEWVKSERKINTLVGNIQGMVYRCRKDPHWTMEYVSEGCVELTGYQPYELINNTVIAFADIIYKDDKEIVSPVIEDAIINKTQFELEYRIVDKNKNIRWVWERGLFVGKDDEDFDLLEGFITDVTERKLILEQLRENEEKYRLITHNSVDVIWKMDLRLRFTYISPSVYNMLGYTTDELIGTKISGYTTKKEFFKIARRAIYAIKNYKKVRHLILETKLIDKNNDVIPVEIIGRLLFNENNLPEGIQGSTRDISERKKSEAIIREKEAFLNTLIEAIPIPIFYKDMEGRYLGFNHAFETFYGMPKNELVGKNVYELNPLDLANIYHGKDIELISNGGFQQYEAKVVTASGNISYAIFNKALFANNKGETAGIIGTILDVTKQKEIEKELMHKNKELFNAKEYLEESEERLKEAQTMAKLGTWNLNLKTNMLSWSDEIYQIFQIDKSVQNLSFETFIHAVHNDDRELLMEAYREHLIVQKPFDITHRVFLQDGTIKYLHNKCYSYFDEEGYAIRSRGTIQDITELKLVEEELLILNQELEQRIEERTAEISKLSQAIIHSPASVMITNPDGMIEYVNPKFTEDTGYSMEEVLGKSPNILNADIHEKNFFTSMWNTIKSGEVWHGEICNKIKSGKIIWKYMSISSIKNKQNQIIHFVAVSEDITIRKQMEYDLHKAKEAAEVANLAKSEFLANMSHEIRTPMNAVLGFADLLSNMVDDKIQKSYLESIKSSGRSLLNIINDILDLSKIEAGKLELEYSIIDLNEIFNELKTIFSLTGKEKNLELIVDVDPKMPFLVYIDELRLRQILMNLLSNAFKFTSRGFVKLSAGVVKRKTNKQLNVIDLKIEVTDTGIGIHKDSQFSIFESFSQQEGQSTKKYGGTGLGLAITQKLVNLMGGEISLQSKINEGSTFRLLFKEIKYTHNKNELADSNRIMHNSIRFLGSTVLIIDDISDNRKYLAGALVNYNLNVLQATSGEEALKVMDRETPELIISDIRMPKMDGFQLLELIRGRKELKNVPVIASTASIMVDSINRIEAAKFSGVLKKPFQTDELLRELIKYLPYKSKTKHKDKPIEDITVKRIEIRNIDELLDKLNLLDEHFAAIKEQQSMEETTTFGKQCLAVAEEFNIQELKEFGAELETAIDSFDVELMLSLIKLFPELAKNIKSAIDIV